ncbi:hypothetical protein GCM10010094_16240 [Streptomyces flaveus]|uniref:Uncharacterized protein n=1 Tax=Streptomyces flaveus TaxID=66370 RepID=A0A917VAM6_9ACTN|nr:hypothetical protein GCM10010094_16240 [Streptomyces flaveus]
MGRGGGALGSLHGAVRGIAPLGRPRAPREAAGLSGARGCIDLRLRRVGATSHNEPAVFNPPNQRSAQSP